MSKVLILVLVAQAVQTACTSLLNNGDKRLHQYNNDAEINLVVARHGDAPVEIKEKGR